MSSANTQTVRDWLPQHPKGLELAKRASLIFHPFIQPKNETERHSTGSTT